MSKAIYSRYERTEAGELILDVAVSRVADLYEDIDKVSPFLKKDLDPHLAQYLVDGAEEIAEKPFIVRISMPELPGGELQDRLSRSVANYFTYMGESERRDMRRMAKTSALLTGVGLGLLLLAAYTTAWLDESAYVWTHVLSEGVTVAGWVSLWHAIATYVVEWAPRHRQLKIYQKLAAAEIRFAARVSLG